MLTWQYKCVLLFTVTKASDIVHGIPIPMRNIWNSGIMNYAWVLGNYVSALEAVGSREWKKVPREFQPTWSNCSQECGLRFSKTSQTVNACSCTRRWPRVRREASNYKCFTRRQVQLLGSNLTSLFLSEQCSHFKRNRVEYRQGRNFLNKQWQIKW